MANQHDRIEDDDRSDAYRRLVRKLCKFRDDRMWSDFHKPKDLAISLSVEASELLANFQWNQHDNDLDVEAICKEMADVFIYLIYLGERIGIDLISAANEKINENEIRYPVESARGIAGKTGRRS